MSTYETLQAFVAKWGLIYFGAIFLVVCAYALWPSRKKEFDRAARLPLNED
jgi:cytochrome c oxidase cbb3-type subunit 4